jgi:protein-S-isoprenylcysteine O-methyltransferase Ste14
MVVGFITRWAGMWTLRKFFSANVAVQCDHQLIVKGPYKVVRHPGYFGGWLAFLGLGLSLGNWISLFILAFLTVPAFLYRISVEERVLRNAFSEYASYAARVKMFIPFVW